MTDPDFPPHPCASCGRTIDSPWQRCAECGGHGPSSMTGPERVRDAVRRDRGDWTPGEVAEGLRAMRIVTSSMVPPGTAYVLADGSYPRIYDPVALPRWRRALLEVWRFIGRCASFVALRSPRRRRGASAVVVRWTGRGDG